MKGVILAAGYGNRLLPFTSYRSKHMLPVAGKAILQHSIEYMRDVLNIHDIIIVVGYHRDIVIDYFKDGSDLGINISYVVQHSGQAHGLAAALSLTEDKIHSDFVLLLGDNLFSANLKKVLDIHSSSNSHATIHVERHDNPSRFGVVELDSSNRILSLEEKPLHPKSNFVISGFYVLSPVIFKMIKGLQPSARGEYELTDALQRLISSGFLVTAAPIDGWRLDIGFPEDLLDINRHYLTELTHSVNSDVSNCNIIPPVYISDNCVLDSSTIGPYTMIERGVTIKNSTVKGSVILESSSLHRSSVSDSVIGTFSNIHGLKGHSLRVGDYSFISNGEE